MKIQTHTWILIFWISLSAMNAQEVPFKIFISRDLKGNIKSCTCTTVPIAGMEGRAQFLESSKVDPKRDILIETGDYLGSGIPMEKYPAVFESFLSMGYHFLGLGGMELKNTSKESWQKYIYSPISSNLQYSATDTSLQKWDTVYRNGREIKFLSLQFPSRLEKIGETYTKNMYYVEPQDFFRELSGDIKADLWIVSLWGTEKEIESLVYPPQLKKIITILNTDSGKKKQELKNKKSLGTLIYQGMENGDEITLIEMDKNFQVIRQRIQTLDAEKYSQNEKISGIIKKYNIK
jgi:hypothetical protein